MLKIRYFSYTKPLANIWAMDKRNEILDNILTLLMYWDVPIYDKLFTENVWDSTIDSLFELMPQFELEDLDEKIISRWVNTKELYTSWQ